MDNRDGWLIYNNKLINDVKNFGVSIKLVKIGDNEEFASQIEGGIVAFLLTIYDRNLQERTECLFPTLDDVTYFINYYLVKCKNILNVGAAYTNFLISEESISKGHVQ